jgi:hypothetical protein
MHFYTALLPVSFAASLYPIKMNANPKCHKACIVFTYFECSLAKTFRKAVLLYVAEIMR